MRREVRASAGSATGEWTGELARRPRPRWTAYRRLLLVVFGVALALYLTSAYLRVFEIAGPAGAPNYLVGDRVLVNLAAYRLPLPHSRFVLARLGEPRLGDVVLVLYPGRELPRVVRVVGLPGDRVELRANRLVLNGLPLAYAPVDPSTLRPAPVTSRLGRTVEREAALGVRYLVTYTQGVSGLADHGPVRVPEGSYFVLADNRDHGLDSRREGPVRLDWIVGRVIRQLPEWAPGG